MLHSPGPRIRDVYAVLDQFSSLGPQDVVSVESEVRALIAYRGTNKLWHDRVRMRVFRPLARVFVFHRNGRLREAALGLIQGDLGSAFGFASIVYRLNDWVPEVRVAALRCARRSFTSTHPAAVAEAALWLIGRIDLWTRWTKRPSIIDEAFCRREVIDVLAARFLQATFGGASRQFRSALSLPPLDSHLAVLAIRAAAPAIRGIALQTLIDGSAKLPAGYTSVWIDKSLGKSRRVPRFTDRPVARQMPLEDILMQGAQDRSASVRRVAADGMVKHRAILENLEELLSILRKDPKPNVRLRAEFVDRERAKGAMAQ